MVHTGPLDLDRLHITRVRVGVTASVPELAYIEADFRITDVVISGHPLSHLYELTQLLAQLRRIPHVNSARLVCPEFIQNPDCLTRTVIQTLGDENHLSVVNPLRLEIETWALEAHEVIPDHSRLTRRLNNRGITVYANVPLLGGVNDSPEAIHDLAHALRSAGVEFHHLYLAGLPVQNRWNGELPVDSFHVIDIATTVRREGSGREIPRYIIATPLGEVDYGLSSGLVRKGDGVKITLYAYDKSYYQSMDETFTGPDDVEWDKEGFPVLPVTGLVKQNDFPIS